MHRRFPERSADRGQSTVELALILPVLITLTLMVVQVGLVARDQVAVHHMAGQAARRAAVDPSLPPVVDAPAGPVGSLDPGRLTVELRGGRDRGDLLTVAVAYRSATNVPLVGALVGDVSLHADAVVRVE